MGIGQILIPTLARERCGVICTAVTVYSARGTIIHDGDVNHDRDRPEIALQKKYWRIIIAYFFDFRLLWIIVFVSTVISELSVL